LGLILTRREALSDRRIQRWIRGRGRILALLEEIMTKVDELEREIEKLSPQELAELRDWLLERDWEMWDRQIESDAASGKLAKLFRKSLEDHQAGKSKEL
jgi:hypothetical protein